MLHKIMGLYESLYKSGSKTQVYLYPAIGKRISKKLSSEEKMA